MFTIIYIGYVQREKNNFVEGKCYALVLLVL